jgi:hypothetical protein
MRRNITLAALAALILSALFGCTLARPYIGAAPNEDKLVGLFVTAEYLDIFDLEGSADETPGMFTDGNKVFVGDARDNQWRLYAEITSGDVTDEATGETTPQCECDFPGADGIKYFYVTVNTPDGGSYVRSVSDEAITDGHLDVSVGDASSVTMTGTIYVSPAQTSRTYHFNPVYQDADGGIYVISGSGISTAGIDVEGAVMSQTLDASYSVTEKGVTKTDSFSVTLGVAVMYAPEKIVVLQMDENSAIVSRTQFTPGTLPDEISRAPRTAYTIVETHSRDGAGEPVVSRKVYGAQDESFDTFAARDDGICVKRATRLG